MCTAPPLLLVGFNTTIINGTDPLRLTCIFSGNPLPTVEWYFQGEQQSEAMLINIGNGTDILLGPGGQEFGLEGSGDTYEKEHLLTPFSITSTIVIAHVTVGNEGIYICNATNGVPNLIGSVTSHTSTVKVQGNYSNCHILLCINQDIIPFLTMQFHLK